MSTRAQEYQQSVGGLGVGKAYVVNGTKFDGYDSSAGRLLEAKGPGYDNLFSLGFAQSVMNKLVAQAARQTLAANGVPITWYVAEAGAAATMRSLLSEDFPNIDIEYAPLGRGTP